MKAWAVLLMILFSITGLTYGFTQDATPDSAPDWTVERRCVDESTSRPDGWTFEGTILVTGDTGIFGVSSNSETPLLVAPLTFEQTDTNIVGGALSPDGRWYASPFGDRIFTESNNVYTTVREIRVYSTLGDNREYSVTLSPAIEGIPAGFYVPTYWQDNQWLLYANGEADVLINPFTQETQQLSGYHFNYVYDRFDSYQRPHLAPDFTLAVSTEGVTSEDQWGLYTVPAEDFSSPESFIQLDLAETTLVAWRPDSRFFAAEQDVESGRQLVFVNRQGAMDDVVFHLPQGERANNSAWSSNNRYFAFITFEDTGSESYYNQYWGKPNTLYIADTQEQVVIDTCLSTGIGLAWSPDGTQLAFLAPGEGTQPIFVMDVEDLTAYPVAKHQVGSNGVGDNYRPNSVIGWRDD